MLRYRQQTLAPLQMCTVLYPYRSGEEGQVKVSPLAIEGRASDDPTLTALCIETPTKVDYLVVDRSKRARRKAFAGQEANSPLAFISHRKTDI